MINPQNIDDQMLSDLLAGNLSQSLERELEQIIASHIEIQSQCPTTA
jgi:hypothetical protein